MPSLNDHSKTATASTFILPSIHPQLSHRHSQLINPSMPPARFALLRALYTNAFPALLLLPEIPSSCTSHHKHLDPRVKRNMEMLLLPSPFCCIVVDGALAWYCTIPYPSTDTTYASVCYSALLPATTDIPWPHRPSLSLLPSPISHLLHPLPPLPHTASTDHASSC